MKLACGMEETGRYKKCWDKRTGLVYPVQGFACYWWFLSIVFSENVIMKKISWARGHSFHSSDVNKLCPMADEVSQVENINSMRAAISSKKHQGLCRKQAYSKRMQTGIHCLAHSLMTNTVKGLYCCDIFAWYCGLARWWIMVHQWAWKRKRDLMVYIN